jgi:ParB-like chromosome segregation protein Spo0J
LQLVENIQRRALAPSTRRAYQEIIDAEGISAEALGRA